MYNEKTKPYSYPTSFDHVLHFNSDIDEPELYAEFADILISASENDTVSIYFATGGGSASTMVQILNLMKNCKAVLNGYLVSNASSAGSFLLLHCDNIFVGDYVEMLVHTVQFGSGGDYPSVKAHVDHVGRQAERLIRDTYKYFLTPEEIDDVLYNNRQMYLDSDEINRRLVVRNTEFEKLHQSSIEAQQAEFMAMINEGDYPDWILNKLTKTQLIKLYKGEIYITDIDEANKKFVIKEDDEDLEE